MGKINQLLNKLILYRGYLLLALLGALYFWAFKYLFALEPLQYGWRLCLDYLEVGRLYKDISCMQGPFFFLSMYSLRYMFGAYFNTVLILITTLLHLSTLFFLDRAIRKLILKSSLLLPLLSFLYTFFIFIPLANDFASLFAMSFLVFGFYTLICSNLKYKELISGFLFSLSLHSKGTALIPFLMILVYYLVGPFGLKLSSIKSRFNVFGVYKLIKLFIPILINLILFTLLLPNVILYTYYAPIVVPGATYTGILMSAKDFFYSSFLKPVWLFFIATFATSLYLLFKKKNLVAIIPLFSLPLLAYSEFKNFGSTFYFYHLIPIIPFVLMGMVVPFLSFLTRKNKLQNLFLSSILLFLVIFSAYSMLSLDPYMTSIRFRLLEDEIHYVYKFIPKQDGYILTDKERFSRLNKNIDLSRVDVFPRDPIDETQATRLEQLGLISSEWHDWLDNGRDADIYLGNIIGGKYSLIVIGPGGNESKVNILSKYVNLLNQAYKINVPRYCAAYVPSLEDRCPACGFSTLINFRNETQCEIFKKEMYDYYEEHFDSICKKDEYAANAYVQEVLIKQGIMIPKKCVSGADILIRLEVKRSRAFSLSS